MRDSLREIQLQNGALFESDCPVPVSYGNDVAAIQAAERAVAVCDRSHWGRIQVADRDRLNFLHNQSTNDFKSLKPGDALETLFITSTARTIDLATAYILADTVLVIVSPQRREYLMQWLDRYIFFGDQVKLTDATEQTAMLSLVGSGSAALLQALGVAVDELAPGKHRTIDLAGQEVRVAAGSGLAIPGYTLIVATEHAVQIWQTIAAAGAVPMGDRVWDQLRIQQGRPMPDQELTEDYNAVEACLWQAISLDKGCYIGQETIARLDTYKGVKQQIWGIRLKHPVEPGSTICVGEEKVGILTSSTEVAGGALGLGYIRTKAGGAGLAVQVGDSEGELVEVPFLRRDRVEPG